VDTVDAAADTAAGKEAAAAVEGMASPVVSYAVAAVAVARVLVVAETQPFAMLPVRYTAADAVPAIHFVAATPAVGPAANACYSKASMSGRGSPLSSGPPGRYQAVLRLPTGRRLGSAPQL